VQINEELNIATASTTQPTKSGTVRNSNLFDVPLDLIEKHMIQYKKENPDEDEHNLLSLTFWCICRFLDFNFNIY